MIDGTNLEWISVKEDYRKQGIATLLLKDKLLKGFNESNLTKIGNGILEKYKQKTKENQNG